MGQFEISVLHRFECPRTRPGQFLIFRQWAILDSLVKRGGANETAAPSIRSNKRRELPARGIEKQKNNLIKYQVDIISIPQVVLLFDPENYRRVHERIKKLWKDGKTEFHFHAERRLRERGIDTNDVNNVIEYGRIVSHSSPLIHWRYVIDGKAVDGLNLRVVVEINDNLLIISVIPRRR